MIDMVYAKGSQVDTDDATNKKKKNPVSVMATVTTALAAFDMLASTDLGSTAQKICEMVKSPIVATLIIGAFVFWTVGGAKE
jgi:hypothetical protein